jgi:hypothetical protein
MAVILLKVAWMSVKAIFWAPFTMAGAATTAAVKSVDNQKK